MAVDLAESVVRVLDAEGNTRGAGFLVARDLVVTCAHVVKKAGGGPGEALHLQSHRGGTLLTARVLPEGWHPDADVAFLRLESAAPAAGRPLPLTRSQGSNGHDYQALGYPEDAPVEARWPQGKIGGLVPVAGWPFDLLQVQGAEVDRASAARRCRT